MKDKNLRLMVCLFHFILGMGLSSTQCFASKSDKNSKSTGGVAQKRIDFDSDTIDGARPGGADGYNYMGVRDRNGKTRLFEVRSNWNDLRQEAGQEAGYLP
jgi:hypothetical protein